MDWSLRLVDDSYISTVETEEGKDCLKSGTDLHRYRVMLATFRRQRLHPPSRCSGGSVDTTLELESKSSKQSRGVCARLQQTSKHTLSPAERNERGLPRRSIARRQDGSETFQAGYDRRRLSKNYFPLLRPTKPTSTYAPGPSLRASHIRRD
jgi:hypothetical protein